MTSEEIVARPGSPPVIFSSAAPSLGNSALAQQHERQQHERLQQRAVVRPVSEIRFKEIAHCVGLSFSRNPTMTRMVPNRRVSSERAESLPSAAGGSSPSSKDALALPPTPSMEPPRDFRSSGDLPSVHLHGRSERTKSQLEWLRAEQRAENEQIRKLDTCLSDSKFIQMKAQRRIEKHQELRQLHAQRAAEVDMQIQRLQGHIAVAESAPRPLPGFSGLKPLSQRSPSGSANWETPPNHEASRGLDGQHATAEENSFGSRAATPGLLVQHAELAAVESKAHRQVRIAGSKDSFAGSKDSFAGSRDSEPPRLSIHDCDIQGAIHVEESLEAHLAAQDVALTTSHLPMAASSLASPALPRKKRRPRTPDEIVRPPALTPEQKEQVMILAKDRIRDEMKEVARKHLEATASSGSLSGTLRPVDSFRAAKAAFRMLDLNGSGRICSQEFADGVTSMGIDWQDITGLTRARDLFHLFDEDRDNVISFRELFPGEAPDTSARPSTPDFCRFYVRQEAPGSKVAAWQPMDQEQELEFIFGQRAQSEEAAEDRKRMRSQLRRLKARGKSDARCREIVAKHLPRGTGPKLRDGVCSFSTGDLKEVQKAYQEDVNSPIRRIGKLVADYKDQRREQRRLYERLYAVTEGMRHRPEEWPEVGGLGLR